ncbi:type II toxin-antitoxin system RelE/ParE family toxin [Methylocaldum sp. MU1018]
MRVVITDSAKANLVEIGEFIRLHNPARAATFVDELLDHCDALADMPRAYPLIPRYEHYGIRRCVHRDYLIFYRILEDEDLVEIIHILHGARDYELLLFPAP